MMIIIIVVSIQDTIVKLPLPLIYIYILLEGRRRDILKAWETIDCCGETLCLSPEQMPVSGSAF